MKYSVKTKLIAVMLAFFAAAAAAYSFISYSSARRSAETVIKSLIEQSAVSAAETLSGKIEAVTAVCDDLSDNDAAFNRAIDEIRLRLLDIRNKNYTTEEMTFDIAYADSLVSIDGVTDYRDNEAVKSAAAGTPLMTAPFERNGKTVVCYASPLSEPYSDHRCVLVCTICCGFFDDVFDVVSLGESCVVYVEDENGLVAGKHSEAANSSAVYSAGAPVENRNGWTVHVEAVPEELMPDFTSDIVKTSVFSALLAAVLCIITSVTLGRTLNPIRKMTARIAALADGDFTSPVPKAKTNDESYAVANALNKTVAALNSCINDMTDMVSKAADGDLSEDKTVLPGDFTVICRAISDMKRSLREALLQVRDISDSVLSSAEKLSDTDSVTVMHSVPNISESEKSLNGFFTERSDISACADKVSDSLNDVKEKLSEEREKLTGLAGTIVAVNGYADDINNVISQIDEIAFHTNILALNAAVEASAAGVHGRSFAVVADEVRALAQRSSEAAKSTEELIKKTVSALSGGASLAKETTRILDEVFAETDNAAELMEEVRSAAEEYISAAGSAEEALSRFSEDAAANAVSLDTEKLEAVVSEARRLHDVTDRFKLK
ncbi:MAG: methyl-accepting chemotaxis protein [Oscillospiraceae bacterium]|nr:methyl-accepting chemotaxis protein [Oscillospiraceae bacterium]